MNTKKDKRNDDRRPFNYPIVLEIEKGIAQDTNILQWPGNGVDISSKGIGIVSQQSLTPGDKVKIHLYLGPKETILPAFSEVRWSRQTDTHYRVGLQFLS